MGIWFNYQNQFANTFVCYKKTVVGSWINLIISEAIIKQCNLQLIKRQQARLMLQAHPNIQKDVERSLNRLQVFLQANRLPDIIPALYYSADTLMKYASTTGADNVNYNYFREFKEELEDFATKDLSSMKQHEREIVDQILGIVNSDLFTQCLQPKIKTSRMHIGQQMNRKTQDMSEETVENIPKSTLYVSDKINQTNQSKKSSSTSDNEKNADKQRLFDTLITSYREHRIDEAHALKNQYMSKQYPLTAQQKQLFNTIDLQYNTMMSFYNQFDMEGWKFDKQQNGVRLQSKLFQQEKQIALRITSEFDITIQHFLAILTEIDLMSAYIPFTYDTKQLKIISRNEKIGASKIYIPCLTDRETYFYAAGYDRIKTNGSIFLFSKTINEDKVYQQKYKFKVPEKSDYVRLEYIFFIVEYIPITKTRAKVRLASKVDLKLNFLPQFILNMSARKFAFDYFKNIIKVNKNFKGSPWEKKIKQNPDYYGFFRKRIEQYMGEK